MPSDRWSLPAFEAYVPGCWAVTFRSRTTAVIYLAGCFAFLAARQLASLISAIIHRQNLRDPRSSATLQ